MFTKRKVKSSTRKERYSQSREYKNTLEYDMRKIIQGKIKKSGTQKNYGQSEEFRLLSQKVFEQKQKLYKRVNRLKYELVKVKDENMRLIDKLISIETENEKLNNIIICQFQDKHEKNKSKQQKILNSNQYIFSLKKKIKDQNEYIQYLELQVEDLKKGKMSKIQDILNQQQNIQEESERHSKFIQEIRFYMKKLEQRYEKQIDDLVYQNKKLKQQSNEMGQKKEILEEKIRRYAENQGKLSRSLIIIQEELQLSKTEVQNLKNKVKQITLKLAMAKTNPIDEEKQYEENQITNSHKYKFKKPQEQIKTLLVIRKQTQQKQLKQFKTQFQNKINNLQEKEETQLRIKPSHQDRDNIKTIITRTDSTKKLYNIAIQQKKQQVMMQSIKQTKKIQKQNSILNIKNTNQLKLTKFKSYIIQLVNLKELLAFRCRAMRVTYEFLRKEIYNLNKKEFTINQLEDIFNNEPFLLKGSQIDTVMIYLFDITSIRNIKQYNSLKISCDILVNKLRGMITDFVIDEHEEQIAYIQIAEMISERREQLQVILDNNKNHQQQSTMKSIDISKMIKLLKGMEIGDNYIEVIISELSLVSPDLTHLHYMQLFQRFSINTINLSESQLPATSISNESKLYKPKS